MDEELMGVGDERRNESRLMCAELVEVTWTDVTGRLRKRVANLEDISLSGVCLQVESPILRGTQVKVQYGDGELVGSIRYCTSRDMAFFLGIQFEDGCKWSTKHFRPQHLLDPQLLVDEAVRRHSERPHA
jgi:hypothetical protein